MSIHNRRNRDQHECVDFFWVFFVEISILWSILILSLSECKRQWWYFMEITLLTPQHHSQKYIFMFTFMFVAMVWYGTTFSAKHILGKTYITSSLTLGPPLWHVTYIPSNDSNFKIADLLLSFFLVHWMFYIACLFM